MKKRKKARKKAKKQVHNRRTGIKLPVAKNKRKMKNTKERELSSFKPEDQKDIVAAKAVKAGDKKAFDQIFNRYYTWFLQKITLMLNDREDAKDCVSDIMAKAYENIVKGNYVATYTFNAWINFMAKNYMIDYSRKSAWKFKLNGMSIDAVFEGEEGGNGMTLSDTLVDDGMATDERIQKSEERKILAEAISTLAEQERVIMNLVCLKEMKYDEVAASEGIPIGTVKAMLFRSRRKVSMYIAKAYPEIADHYTDIAKSKPKEVSLTHEKKTIMVDGEEHYFYSV